MNSLRNVIISKSTHKKTTIEVLRERRLEFFMKDIDKINSEFIPPEDMVIARYMGFSTFKMTIENGLWLSDSKFFSDQYEGEIPTDFFNQWNNASIKNYKNLYGVKSDFFPAYITCWFQFEKESETMWGTYGVEKAANPYSKYPCGVAITSTVVKLKNVIQKENAKVFKVRYIDPAKSPEVDPPIIFRQHPNSTAPNAYRVFYAYKRHEYEDEKEIRGITYATYREEGGISIKVNWNDFIDKIIINPHASVQDRDLIKEYIENQGLAAKLVLSTIKCNKQ